MKIDALQILAVLFLITVLAAGCDSNGSDDDEASDADSDGDSDSDSDSDADGDCAGGPLDLPIAGCTPTPVPNTGDFYADCVTRINQFRWECQCLPPLSRWHEGEECADDHAEYDSENGAHAGFIAGICTPGGWAQNECPGWGSGTQIIDGCLQMMWDEGPGEPFSEHGHYINMSSTNYTNVACGIYTTNSGDVWSVQNFE